MEKVKFIKNAKVRFRDEADVIVKEMFCEAGTFDHFDEEVARQLIAEGVAIPAGPQFTPPMSQK